MTARSDAFLEARNVRKVFTTGGLFRRQQETVALDNFSLTIRESPPAFTTIAGESGSGKTTLANLLLGFLAPTSGQVFYRGKDVQAMTRQEHVVYRREIQAIFQDPFEVYNPFYKVDHMLTTPISMFGLAKSQDDARDIIVRALNGVGLRPEETMGRYPHQLSGGQRQRITIARALILRPRLIIADEPVSMVDASLRATILESLKRLNQELGISFLYITHDLTTAYQISENIIVLYKGTVAEVGDVEQVIQGPKHPYTQELVSSIPWPDPERRWGRERFVYEGGKATGVVKSSNYCRYADRCPFAMQECREGAPPLFQVGPHQAAACFLHKSAPVVKSEDMMQVFTTSGLPSGTAKPANSMPASSMPSSSVPASGNGSKHM
jgi:peptide/nickel transport system ATP-binding protein